MTINLRQSTESRQAEIIATMLALAAECNPAEITTTDIAKAMNVTQGALFRHFPTKEAIRVAVVEWIEAQLLGELVAARQAAPGPLEALAAMFMAHVRFARQYPGAPRLIFSELQTPEDSPVRLGVRRIMQRYRQNLAQVMAEASEKRLIRPGVDVPAAASLFIGAIQGLVIQSLLGGEREAEAHAHGVLQLYLASLGVKS